MSDSAVFGMVVSAILIILGFVFKKNRLIGVIQLVWIFLLMGLNTGGADYAGNKVIFELSKFGTSGLFEDVLYKNICAIFKDIGLDFVWANIIFSLFSIIVINYVVSKRTKNKNFAFSLFMIFPILEFIVQKRAFLAMPFDLLAMDFLFSDKKRKYLRASLLVFAASLIHSSSYFFFLVIVLYYLRERFGNDKRFNRLVIILVLMAFFALPLIPGYATYFFGTGKVELYLSEGTISVSSAIGWILIHVSFVLLQKWLPKICANELPEDSLKYEKFVSKVNIVSLMLIPLYMYESAFFRLFKVILVLNYISVANRMRGGAAVLGGITYIMYVLFVFMLLYVWTGYGFDAFVVPLFDNNIFLSWIGGGFI